MVLSAAGILFPSLLTLNVLAGTWLMIAPWLVGYGSHNGPVGLSDTVAGLIVIIASLTTLSDSARRTRPAEPQAVARIQAPGIIHRLPPTAYRLPPPIEHTARYPPASAPSAPHP